MSKTTRRLATAAATLAVAGGVLFAAGGAASADTYRGEGHNTTTAARHDTARHDGHRWDSRRWWDRHDQRGDWYSSYRGDRYRFDGHHFSQWSDGGWRTLADDYAHHHGFDGRDLSGDRH
jgi:hypothetical protein